MIFHEFNQPESHTANKYIIGKEIFRRLRIWMLFFSKSGHVLYTSWLKWIHAYNRDFLVYFVLFSKFLYFIVLFYTINSKLLDSYYDLMTGFTVETYTNKKYVFNKSAT